MKIKGLAVVLALSLFTNAANAQYLKVAAAANLQSVIKALQQDFKKRSGITIEPIIGSSGNLVAQISNGAPYDVFLSADMEFPEKLFKNGITNKPPVVYALGSLVVCSKNNIDLKNWQKLIITNAVQKIAIANPKIAPYGRAAEESLQKLNLLDKVKLKTVYGESISQVNTYITTGVVNMGFTTQSLVMDPTVSTKLYWQPVDTKIYSAIEQGVVILKHAHQGNEKAAIAFYNYMLGVYAKSILKKYGYIVP